MNLFFNPPNYSFAFYLQLIAIGLGYFLANRFDDFLVIKRTTSISPNLAKTAEELSLNAQNHAQEGLLFFNNDEADHGWASLRKGVNFLLETSEVNRQEIESIFQKLLQDNYQLLVDFNEISDMAGKLESKKFYRESLGLLEKALFNHPPENMARHALLRIASMRLTYSLEPELARKELNRVLMTSKDDTLAQKAQTLLKRCPS